VIYSMVPWPRGLWSRKADVRSATLPHQEKWVDSILTSMKVGEVRWVIAPPSPSHMTLHLGRPTPSSEQMKSLMEPEMFHFTLHAIE